MAEQVVAEYKLQVDQAVSGLNKLQSEYAKTEAASRKAAQTSNDSFIKGSEGAKRLDAELKKQPKTLAEMELKLRNLRELLRDDTKIGTEGFKKIRAEIDKTEKEVQKLNGDLKKTGTEMSGLGGMAKKLGGFLAAAFAVDRIVAFGKEAVQLAAKAEGVERAFERIGSPQILQGLREATRGTVSDLQLMQNAVKASNFKIPLESLASLFKFAQARARETGESVDYLVDSIILGIGRKSPLILDNLGISAVELRTRLKGVGVEAANVGDIAAIIGDIATEELAKMGDQADTTADKIAQITTAIENTKIEFGKVLINELIALQDNFGGLGDQVKRLTDSGESIQGWAKVASFALRSLTFGFTLVGSVAERTLLIVNGVKDGLVELAENAKIEAFRLSLSGDELERFNELGRTAQLIMIRRNGSAEDYADFTDDATRATQLFNKALVDLDGQATEPYVRSLNKLNEELKELDTKLKDAEVGSSAFWDILDKVEKKTKELNEAVAMTKLADAFKIDEDEFPDFGGSVIGYAEEVARETDIADKLWEAHFNELMRLQDEEIANRKANQQIALEITQQTLSTMSQMVGSIAQIQQNAFMKEQQELQKQLEQGLITREEFEQKELQIRRKAAAAAKDAAIFQAVINTAQAVMQALANTPPPASYALAAVAGALGAVQIAAIASEPLPQFAEGVIGLKGAGTETSDSIPAMLSKNESVMTAAETRKYKDELWAIRRGNFEDLIMTKYVKPMIDESLFKGFADMGKSAQLNGLTANLKDHNILAAIDRDRQATVYGLNLVATKLDKLSRTNTRRGW